MSRGYPDKAELLQLKPHPFVCIKIFIGYKSWEIEKTKPTFSISVLKVVYSHCSKVKSYL